MFRLDLGEPHEQRDRHQHRREHRPQPPPLAARRTRLGHVLPLQRGGSGLVSCGGTRQPGPRRPQFRAPQQRTAPPPAHAPLMGLHEQPRVVVHPFEVQRQGVGDHLGVYAVAEAVAVGERHRQVLRCRPVQQRHDPLAELQRQREFLTAGRRGQPVGRDHTEEHVRTPDPVRDLLTPPRGHRDVGQVDPRGDLPLREPFLQLLHVRQITARVGQEDVFAGVGGGTGALARQHASRMGRRARFRPCEDGRCVHVRRATACPCTTVRGPRSRAPHGCGGVSARS